jgi:GT2 family glycosyltransferase
LVSFAIATRNRRQTVLQTLSHISECGLASQDLEVLVVDNRSIDGSPAAIAQTYPHVQVIRSRRNLGSCGKQLAVARARGRFIVFLDDDSWPQPGAIAAMIAAFDAEPRLGAVIFAVDLPDGRQEASAYPDVFVGCGVGFRAEALQDAGSLPSDFFTQAEEYDLALRLMDRGWTIGPVAGARVTHLKTPAGRVAARTIRMDVRNNLLVLARRAPITQLFPMLADWLGRYWLIARATDRRRAFLLGAAQGIARFAGRPRRAPVRAATFEQFTRARQIQAAVTAWAARHNLQSIILADLGKNVRTYWQAARKSGLRVVAVADDLLAENRYRGIPIVSTEKAAKLDFDGVLVANSAPVHSGTTAARWRAITPRPVLDAIDFQEAGPPRPARRVIPYVAARKAISRRTFVRSGAPASSATSPAAWRS